MLRLLCLPISFLPSPTPLPFRSYSRPMPPARKPAHLPALLQAAINILKHQNVAQLPVVNADSSIAGMVSSQRIVASLALGRTQG